MNVSTMTLNSVLMAALVLFLLSAAGCYDVATNFESCETDAECIDSSGGEYDYCGQEGQDFCCAAGSYKCGCIGDETCNEGSECYACTDDVCPNGQPTICLDIFGAAAGLELVE